MIEEKRSDKKQNQSERQPSRLPKWLSSHSEKQPHEKSIFFLTLTKFYIKTQPATRHCGADL